MKKQTNKLISWMLSAAMVFSLAGGVITRVSAEEVETQKEIVYTSLVCDNEAVDWNTGGDGDCRIEVSNEWGKTKKPSVLAKSKFNAIELSFTVEDFDKAGDDITSATAALCFNTKNDGPSNWDVGGADNKDAVINGDGDYTVSYTNPTGQLSELDAYLAVRIPGLDSAFSVGDDKLSTGPVKFSNVKITLYGASALLYEEALDWNAGRDGDCRMEISNEWGKTKKPEALVGTKFNAITVSFAVTDFDKAADVATSAAATLCFNTKNDGPSNWDVGGADNIDAVINSDGEYTVSYTNPTGKLSELDAYLAVRIPALDSAFSLDADKNSTGPVKFSDVKVTVYGFSKGAEASSTEKPQQTATPPAQPTATVAAGNKGNIVYHAAMGIQTAGGNKKSDKSLWISRFGYYGKIDAVGFKNISGYGTKNWDKLMDQDKKAYAGKFTDVEIKDNGTYTVSLDGADFAGETVCSQLHIATDIPMNSKIQFSDLKVSVDGKEILKHSKGYLEDDDTYTVCGKVYLLINHWRSEVEELGKKAGLKLDGDGFSILTGEKNEKVSITFTVSGFDQKAEQQVQKEEQQKKQIASRVGKTKTIDGLRYKITKAAKNGGNVTLTKDMKNVKKRIVPAAVKIDGIKYKVTAIGASAFAKNKKLQKVVIGKNVKTIGKKAFYNCKKLKSIDVKKNVSLKKVGKNIVKGNKCKVLAPKKKLKAYKKLFKKLNVR